MNDKPDLRERVFARGLGYPSNEELLMLILGSGTKQCPVEALAKKVKDVIDVTGRENLIDALLKFRAWDLGKLFPSPPQWNSEIETRKFSKSA